MLMNFVCENLMIWYLGVWSFFKSSYSDLKEDMFKSIVLDAFLLILLLGVGIGVVFSGVWMDEAPKPNAFFVAFWQWIMMLL